MNDFGEGGVNVDAYPVYPPKISVIEPDAGALHDTSSENALHHAAAVLNIAPPIQCNARRGR